MPELIPSTHNQQEALTVSQISARIKRTVEEGYGYVRVRGEISGLKVAASGHVYLSLKDSDAVLNAVCWKGVAGKLPFKPEDGVEVICAGRITTYPGRSYYQLVVEYMEPAGAGALMALLEKRKAMLAAEGLFDPARKQELPYLPSVIGVITSPTGAVIRDILHRLADRFPCRVIVWPVLVQGEGAAEQLAAAIRGFNALPEGDETFPRPDVLIVARGGGALEDLWAFNEEIVVRAAAESHIPLISAVGHETDTTLIDFASDQRAPTPTAAAEMAVPVRADLVYTLQSFEHRMARGMMRTVAHSEEVLKGLARGLPHPVKMLQHAMQRLDDWSERLGAALPAVLTLREHKLEMMVARLSPASLAQSVKRHGEDVRKLTERLQRVVQRMLDEKTRMLSSSAQLLQSLNYENILQRGFAIVRGAQGEVITSSTQAQSGADYRVTFKDGDVTVKVK